MPPSLRLLALAGAVALAVAGCGASSATPRAAADRPSVRATTPAADASSPTSLTPTGVVPPAVPAPSAALTSPTTGSGAVSHPVPTRAAAAPHRSTPASRPATGTSTGALGFTAPGTYTYTTSGTTRTVLGSRPATAASTLRVAAPVGTTQQSTLSGPDGTTEQVLQSRADGLYLVDISISAAGFTADFRPAQPVLFLPSPPRVGRGWSWQITSADGKYVVSGSFTVTGQSSAVVGGTAVPCLVVPATVRITGSGLAITMARTECASTRYVLPVSEHSVSDGTAFATPYHADITRALTSIRPS